MDIFEGLGFPVAVTYKVMAESLLNELAIRKRRELDKSWADLVHASRDYISITDVKRQVNREVSKYRSSLRDSVYSFIHCLEIIRDLDVLDQSEVFRMRVMEGGWVSSPRSKGSVWVIPWQYGGEFRVSRRFIAHAISVQMVYEARLKMQVMNLLQMWDLYQKKGVFDLVHSDVLKAMMKDVRDER